MRSPKPVSTSGSASRSAAPGTGTPAHNSQPSCEPAPRTSRSAPSIAIVSGPKRAASALGQVRRARGRARRTRTARRARAGPRRRRPACRRPRPAGRHGPSSWRIPPPVPFSGVSASRQPCWPSPPPAAGRGPQRTSRRRAPARRAATRPLAPRRRELVRERAVAGGGEHVEEPRRRVGRAVVAQPTLGPVEAEEAGRAVRRTVADLVDDLARLLVPHRVVLRALQARERAERGARHVRALGQDLQRRDEGVAAEERVEAPRVVRVGRRCRRVRPAVGREDVVEAGDAQRISLRIWWTSVSSSAPGARASPRSRATTSSAQSCVWSRRKRSIATRR